MEKQPLGPISIALFDDSAVAKTARGTWAHFIKKVFEVDLLVCPDFWRIMRIISFIDDPRVVRAILVHLSLWETPRPRPPPVTPGAPADI